MYHSLPTATAEGSGCLFSGDGLFVAGCGKIFEGTAAMMLQSLDKIACLPPDTFVCPGHEYGLMNLLFSKTIDPTNPAVTDALFAAAAAHSSKTAFVPSQLRNELKYNPFFHPESPAIAEALIGPGTVVTDYDTRATIFSLLRAKKDKYFPTDDEVNYAFSR